MYLFSPTLNTTEVTWTLVLCIIIVSWVSVSGYKTASLGNSRYSRGGRKRLQRGATSERREPNLTAHLIDLVRQLP